MVGYFQAWPIEELNTGLSETTLASGHSGT